MKAKSIEKSFALIPAIGLAAMNDMSPSDLRIYLVLCKRRDNKDNTCYPTLEQMAKETDQVVRSVTRSIDRLQKLGLIAITKGSKGNNIYEVLFDVEVHTEAVDLTQLSIDSNVHRQTSPETGQLSAENQDSDVHLTRYNKLDSEELDNSSASAEEPTTQSNRASRPKRQIEFFEHLFEPKQLAHEKFWQTWKDFVQMRFDKGKAKQVTEIAAKRLIKTLREHRDPIGLMDLSIEGGWLNLIPEAYDKRYGSSGFRQRPNGPARQQSAHEERIRNQSSGINIDDYREHFEASRSADTAPG